MNKMNKRDERDGPNGEGLVDFQLRATFSPAYPLADIFHTPYPPIALQSISRNVPLARARVLQFTIPLCRGVGEAALHHFT